MKVSELIAIRPSIEKIASKEHNFADALKFAKFVRDVLIVLQDFDIKRAELFNKYGAKQGENNSIVVPPGAEANFKEEMQKELDKEIEIEKMDVSALDMQVAPADLINCIDLFR